MISKKFPHLSARLSLIQSTVFESLSGSYRTLATTSTLRSRRIVSCFSYKWGSSGCAEQRNFKKICRGRRNLSSFSAERRNSPSPPEADFLENDKQNAEF